MDVTEAARATMAALRNIFALLPYRLAEEEPPRKYWDPTETTGCDDAGDYVLLRLVANPDLRTRLCLSLWDLVCFSMCCIALLAAYLVARTYVYKSRKQRSWVLTCLNSVVTPLLALRSLFRIVNNEWEYGFVSGGSRSSRICTLFFMAYLCCELVVGHVDYRKQVTLIMGYVHHFSYLLLASHLLVANRTNIMAMTLLEELPTLVLALSRLAPGWFAKPGQSQVQRRSLDYAFALSFVVTRILFHLYVQYNLFLWRKDSKLGYYWVVCVLALAMNLHWLLAWWKSAKRRREKDRKRE